MSQSPLIQFLEAPPSAQQSSFDEMYNCERMIGRGGQGTVSLIKCKDATKEKELSEQHLDLNKLVAKQVGVKLEQMHEREKIFRDMRNEIHLLQSLPSHPNVVRYVEYIEEQDRLSVVLEYASAGDVGSQIKARAKRHSFYYTYREVLVIFSQLCLAVQHLHSNGVVHRDIKCANLFLSAEALLKLGDFGLARSLKGQHTEKSTNDERVDEKIPGFAGTAYYCAPEVWQEHHSTKKSDIWSMGVTLFELLTLRRPFVGTTIESIRHAVCHQPLPLIHDCDAQLYDLIGSMVQRDPAQRPGIESVLAHPLLKEGLRLYVKEVCCVTSFTSEMKQCIFESAESYM